MRTSAKPNKLYIIRKVLMRAIQKCTFYWIWATMAKAMGIYGQFWHFLLCPLQRCHLTQEVNVEKLYFFLILYLILGKVTNILVEKLSTWEVISQKPHGDGKRPPPPVLLGLNKNSKTEVFKNLRFLSLKSVFYVFGIRVNWNCWMLKISDLLKSFWRKTQ